MNIYKGKELIKPRRYRVYNSTKSKEIPDFQSLLSLEYQYQTHLQEEISKLLLIILHNVQENHENNIPIILSKSIINVDYARQIKDEIIEVLDKHKPATIKCYRPDIKLSIRRTSSNLLTDMFKISCELTKEENQLTEEEKKLNKALKVQCKLTNDHLAPCIYHRLYATRNTLKYRNGKAREKKKHREQEKAREQQNSRKRPQQDVAVGETCDPHMKKQKKKTQLPVDAIATPQGETSSNSTANSKIGQSFNPTNGLILLELAGVPTRPTNNVQMVE